MNDNFGKYVLQARELISSLKGRDVSSELGGEFLHSFFYLYLIAYYNLYMKFDSWCIPEQIVNIEEIKKEACIKINSKLFANWRVSEGCIDIVKWLHKNPPIKETNYDILGEIYLAFSTHSDRKRNGEHYTKVNFVNFIIDKFVGAFGVDNSIFSYSRMIDPACGSGNFLLEVIRRAYYSVETEEEKIIIDKKIQYGQLITGVDIQETACMISKIRLLIELIGLGRRINPKFDLPIYNLDSLSSSHKVLQNDQYDIVLTNPPYLRYQSIDKGRREEFSDKYISATGRYDLYTIFIEKSVLLANKSGKIGVFCPDKYMTAAYGRGVRQFILDNSSLLSVLDFSPMSAFEDATVISSMYFFSRHVSRQSSNPKWEKVFELSEESSIVKEGLVELSDTWRYGDTTTNRVFEKIRDSKKAVLLSNICRIFVGIKTTADDVFCKRLTNSVVKDLNLEQSLVHPLLRGGNLFKWGYSWSGERENTDTNILYPYEIINGKTISVNLSDYPNVKRYLVSNKERLEKREYVRESTKKWYEHWVPLSHKIFSQTKIITPDIASSCTFSLDEEGFFCNGTIYGLQYKDSIYGPEEYRYLLGILNSKIIDFFHRKNNPIKIRSSKFRFQTATMRHYPVIMLAKTDLRFTAIIRLVNELLIRKEHCLALETELNRIVYDIYGLDESEISIIEEYLCN